MAAPRKKQRKFGHSDQAFSFARRFTLAHIGVGRETGHDVVEPAWDGHRVLATRSGRETRLAAADFRDWTATFPQIGASLGKLAIRLGLQVDTNFRVFRALYGTLSGGYMWSLGDQTQTSGGFVGGGLDFGRVHLEAVYDVLEPASQDQRVQQALLRIGINL